MDRHCANARAVVDLLVGHPAVERVLYPQLPDHPGHAAAAKQMRDFGGMVSFTVRGGDEAAKRVAASTELFTLAESLGAVESLIEHPGEMTHASAPARRSRCRQPARGCRSASSPRPTSSPTSSRRSTGASTTH